MKAKTALYAVVSGLAVLLLVLQPAAAVAGEEGECPIGAYVEVWNSGNLDGLDAVVAETIKRHVNAEITANNITELKGVIATFRESFPDVTVTISEAFWNKGKSKSVACWTATGTNKATAKQVTFSGMSVAHWAEGKVVEEWVVYDNLAVDKQLGYTITPPPELRKEKE